MVLFALLLLVVPAGADDQPAHLTHEQAVKDTRTFVQLLEATHPDPYTNLGGKVAFKRKAQQMVKNVPADGFSVPELADALGLFIAPLRDGHTTVRSVRERWQDPSPRLAVQFRIASDGLLISAFDVPELKGARGSKLIAVNGQTIEHLLDRISAELATENIYGSYTGLVIALRSFKLLKNLIPDLDRAHGVTYTLEMPNGNREERTVSWEGEHAVDPEKWMEKPVRWAGLDHSDDPFYFRIIDGGETAYFRVANMMPREGYEVVVRYHVGNLKEMLEQYYKAHKQEMPADLDEAMRRIPSLFEKSTQLLEEMKRRNAANLIIDMRGNGGGSTPTIMPFFYEMYGDAYFGRHSQAEFLQVKSQLYLQKYNSSVEQERKKNPDFEIGEYVFSGDEPGTGEEKRKKKLAEWKERGFSFVPALEALNGKPLYTPKRVFVLCDPGTFSAAFQATFQLHEMGAILVGVPPAQSPNAFMEGTEYVLPESHIHGYISNGMQMYIPSDPKINVLHPDHEVSYTVFKRYDFDDDTSLRYALDLLETGGAKGRSLTSPLEDLYEEVFWQPAVSGRLFRRSDDCIRGYDVGRVCSAQED